MSAIDAFTAFAIAAVALYVGRDSPVLAAMIVFGSGGLFLMRMATEWATRRASWHAKRLDRWLGPLPVPIARYPRARSGQGGCAALIITVPVSWSLALAVAPSTALAFLVTLVLLVVLNAVAWHALRERPSETWLYEDRLAIVHEVSGAEWWPFDRIRRLRCFHARVDDGVRVEWVDDAFRRLVVAPPACAEHVVRQLESAAAAVLAERLATSVRLGGVVINPPRARLSALACGSVLGVIVWLAASFAGDAYQREAAIERLLRKNPGRLYRNRHEVPRTDILGERRSDANLTTWFALAIPLGVALALALERARAETRRVVLTPTQIQTHRGSRVVGWQDVRRVVDRGPRIGLEGAHGAVEIERDAWDAVLVPRVAQILARDVGAAPMT